MKIISFAIHARARTRARTLRSIDSSTREHVDETRRRRGEIVTARARGRDRLLLEAFQFTASSTGC